MEFIKHKYNIEILLSNYLSNDLPDDIFNYDIDKIINILDAIYREEYSEVYTLTVHSRLICKLKLSATDTPSYIYNDGTEPIQYFDYKNNTRYRGMSIPNFNFFIAFVYNSIVMFEEIYVKLYDRMEHEISNTPIISKENGILNFVLDEYGGLEDIENIEGDCFISEEHQLSKFSDKVIDDIIAEGTNLYCLETDIENFYSSIYTHNFEELHELFTKDTYTKARKDYFIFLDYYNMKINKNHTKGILTGPISSRISSELLLISIDRSIKNELGEEIEYKRYLDDMWFYGNINSKLEIMQYKLQEILRDSNLEIQHEKTKIVKNIKKRKTGQRYQVYLDFPFLKNSPENHYTFSSTDLLHLNSLISNDSIDLSYWKTYLTIVTNKIEQDILVIDEEKIRQAYLVMILKFGLLHNPLQTRIYKLIDIILKKYDDPSNYISELLTNNLTTMDQSYSDTIGQIWHYKILLSCLDSEKRTSLLDRTISKYNHKNKDINPIVLFYFIQNDSDKINKKIFLYIRTRYCKKLGLKEEKSFNQFPDGISNSKWFLLLVQLKKVGNFADKRLELLLEKNDLSNNKLQMLNSVYVYNRENENLFTIQ